MDSDDGARLDPRTLRGLAHPLRVRMLNLLRERGPSTASKLAELLGQSSGATSYHLRQLATYGFVEDAGGGSGRERWWRAAHARTDLDADTGRAAGEATEGYLRAVATADFQRVEATIGDLPGMSEAWQNAFFLGTEQPLLSATQAVELRGRIKALIDEYAEAAPADAARVSVQWQILPMP
ncbi:winged helix-turn-helix transcriptional regulator [Actinoplanes sp. LDG1-06]|uniref:Winged helix-turn-helix transcriptional regulator n=1 Tax=Paractinoplanes ovalisporus TaxID=2810368 RepID=A0ABS2ADD3_9ACTN|nr:winged helix-turn-helix domain-containing protein [Actinoplanes ovalisporus]MBM2617835.1 winged helix-turn-helix transcriptional regulator [Actinoplanes ovalisporus]